MQDLIELICNVKAMEEAVMEMQYDVKKAPLGEKRSVKWGQLSVCAKPHKKPFTGDCPYLKDGIIPV